MLDQTNAELHRLTTTVSLDKTVGHDGDATLGDLMANGEGTPEDAVMAMVDTDLLDELLNRLLDVATASGFHAVVARIEASGTASRALHNSCGFGLVGIEREVGRKFNRWLDVAVMQCVLHERTAARRRSPATPS